MIGGLVGVLLGVVRLVLGGFWRLVGEGGRFVWVGELRCDERLDVFWGGVGLGLRGGLMGGAGLWGGRGEEGGGGGVGGGLGRLASF